MRRRTADRPWPLKEVQQELTRLTDQRITMRKVDGEYIVKFRGDSDDAGSTYFTNDLKDAFVTGLSMVGIHLPKNIPWRT